jgi:hypothetical protein
LLSFFRGYKNGITKEAILDNPIISLSIEELRNLSEQEKEAIEQTNKIFNEHNLEDSNKARVLFRLLEKEVKNSHVLTLIGNQLNKIEKVGKKGVHPWEKYTTAEIKKMAFFKIASSISWKNLTDLRQIIKDIPSIHVLRQYLKKIEYVLCNEPNHNLKLVTSEKGAGFMILKK